MKSDEKWVKEYVMEKVNNNSENCLFTTYTKLLHGLSKMGDVYRLTDPNACGDALFILTNSGIIRAHTDKTSYIAFMKKREDFKEHLYSYSIAEGAEKIYKLFSDTDKAYKWRKMWFASCLTAEEFIKKHQGVISGEKFGL